MAPRDNPSLASAPPYYCSRLAAACIAHPLLGVGPLRRDALCCFCRGCKACFCGARSDTSNFLWYSHCDHVIIRPKVYLSGLGSGLPKQQPAGSGLSGAQAAPTFAEDRAPAAAAGTGAVKFEAVPGTETLNDQTVIVKYQSITAMPQYHNRSAEELRAQDYAAGRKGGAQVPAPVFGQGAGHSLTFGAPPAQHSSPPGLFSSGATHNTFGIAREPAAPVSGSDIRPIPIFGGATAFGVPARGSAVGAPTPTSATGSELQLPAAPSLQSPAPLTAALPVYTNSAAVQESGEAAALAKMRMERCQQLNPTSSNAVIQLNVGGRSFTTCVGTLCKYPDSVLGWLFSPDRFQARRLADGSVFLDADPDAFYHILNWLRLGVVTVDQHASTAERNLVLALASHLQLNDLVQELGGALPAAPNFQASSDRSASQEARGKREGDPSPSMGRLSQTLLPPTRAA